MTTRKIVKKASVVAFPLVFLFTAGCASIVGGTHQSVAVNALSSDGKQVDGADCELANSKGTWHMTAPGNVTIHRAGSDLSISCRKSGVDVGSNTKGSNISGWLFGNLVFGGIIGAGVDFGTGAAFKYPATITVRSASDINTLAQRISGASGDAVVASSIPLEAPVAVSATANNGSLSSDVAVSNPRLLGVPAPVVSNDSHRPAGIEQGSPIASADNGTGVLPTVQRDVTSGVATMVAAHADWDTLCQASGSAPTISMLENSQHGTWQIKQGKFAAPANNAPSPCADGQIYGSQLYYSPNPGFHGHDHLRYQVVAQTGVFTREVEIVIK